MKTPIEALRAFVENNRQEMLLFWESLVNMQAGSKEVDKINRIIDFLKKHFEAEGIDCRLVDSKPISDAGTVKRESCAICFTSSADTFIFSPS